MLKREDFRIRDPFILVEGDTYYVVCRALNVRPTAGTRQQRIGLLNRGDAVQVLSIEGGWARIAYNGGVAYVSASYIAK